jgi:putative DNA primase/helicase
MSGPTIPDPSKRKFFLVRVDLNDEDSSAWEVATPIDPQTGDTIDATNPTSWMTFDEAKLWADTWGIQNHSPQVEFRVAAAIVAPAPLPPDPYTRLVDRTDAGNANLLIRLTNGNLRHVHETKQWLRWDSSRWELDQHEVFVTTHALEVAKYYLREAHGIRKGEYRLTSSGRVEDSEEIYKWGIKCRGKGAIEAMITLARKVPGVPISITELDRDPWLLGVKNGVLDLRTGELRETEAREDYVTKRCPVRYNPAMAAPRWGMLIAEITGAPLPAERGPDGDVIANTVGRFTQRPGLARYLQKALGYSLTGSTREQKFFIAIGDGSNGKSVVFDTVKQILGPYGVTLPSEAFLAASRETDAERPTAFAAGLAGARFVVSSETKAGQKLDIGVIKNHTGDREMTARRLYGAYSTPS